MVCVIMNAALMEQKIEDLRHRVASLEERIQESPPEIILKEIMNINRIVGTLTEKVEYINGNILEINEKIQNLTDKIYSVEEKLTEKINNTENNLRKEISEVNENLTNKINNTEKNLIDRINTIENNLRKEISEVNIDLTNKINNTEKNLRKEISELGKAVSRTDYMLKFIIALLLVAIGVIIKSIYYP